MVCGLLAQSHAYPETVTTMAEYPETTTGFQALPPIRIGHPDAESHASYSHRRFVQRGRSRQIAPTVAPTIDSAQEMIIAVCVCVVLESASSRRP